MNCQKQGFTACCPRDLPRPKAYSASQTLIVQMFLHGTHVAKNRNFRSAKQEKYAKIIIFSAFELAKLASYLQIYASQGADKFGN